MNATTITIAMISISFTKHLYNESSYHYYGMNGIERTLCVLRIISSIIGIIGAIYYKIYFVGFAATMYMVDTILAILGFNYINFIIGLLFVYPHYFLMKELDNGIITEENYYTNEEHSCCCI